LAARREEMIALGTDATDFEYDIALTFAGENRAYVEPIAQQLREAGVRVFYADFEQGRLWGEDLYVFFDAVFRKKARHALMFVSAAYVEKHWPMHEAKSVQARALEKADSPYLLPVKLDDVELPGLRPTVGYIDARVVGRDRLVELVLEKLEAPMTFDRVPRTLKEEEALKKERPPAWEYLLFGAVLRRERDALDEKYRDHLMKYRRFSVGPLDEDQARELLQMIFGEITGIVDNLNRLLTEETQTRAFGPPGEEGRIDEIEHLGSRLVDVYEEILDWSARVRGAAVPEQFEEVFAIASSYADGPIEQFRAFVDDFVGRLDEMPAKLAAGEDVHLILELKIELIDGQMEAFNAAMTRLRTHYGI
jgi:hypothetical protein